MTLRDFIIGKRVELVSPLSIDEISRRINARTPSMFNPLGSGVGGWARFGRIRLDWRIPMFSNGFAPKFWARMTDDLGLTRICGRFGAPRFFQVFLFLWYLLLGVFSASFLSAWVHGSLSTSNDPMVFVAIPGMAAAPLLFHFVFNRGADRHFDEILCFLEREVEARSATAPAVPPSSPASAR